VQAFTCGHEVEGDRLQPPMPIGSTLSAEETVTPVEHEE
jgi:hypothetical protein